MAGDRLVYSTDVKTPRTKSVRATPKVPRPGAVASGSPAVPRAPDDGCVRLWRVKGGRSGKTATVITGVPGAADDLARLAVDLRRFVGAGGSVRDGAIEIQGDHRERLQRRLAELGYRVKLAGG